MIEDVEEFVSIVSSIVHNDMAFNMRRRLNPHHSDEDKAYEKTLHDANQQQLWLRAKEYFLSNRDEVLRLINIPHIRDDHKRNIKAICAVIDKEIEDILLIE